MKTTKSKLKITVAVGFILLALVWAATAQTNVYRTSVTLGWDHSVSTNVVGYRIYKGGVSGIYTNQMNVTYTNVTIVSYLDVGSTYYFAVTAKNSAGLESPFSNEVAYTANIVVLPPVQPTNTLVLQGSILVATNPAGPWIVLTNFAPVMVTNNGITKFYNAVVGVK